MISVCYLSSTRRRRARSRWCWAPAPGGCWMWLGRERKTTKTTVWCTAKVSKRRRPASCYLPAAQHATPQSSIHFSPACLPPSLGLSPLSFTFSLLFRAPPHFSKSQTRTNNCICTAARTHKRGTRAHTPPRAISAFLIQCVIYITKTLIRNWETSLDTQS